MLWKEPMPTVWLNEGQFRPHLGERRFCRHVQGPVEYEAWCYTWDAWH